MSIFDSDASRVDLPMSFRFYPLVVMFFRFEGEQNCRLEGFVYWLNDKTGLERITVNFCQSSVTSGPCGDRMRKCCAITRICTVAQSVSTSAWPVGCDTPLPSAKALVCDVHDEAEAASGKESFSVRSKSCAYRPP
ncbi:GL14963 [Drosophila persimilis]|uniref:GL14963 n=1 Tax=Drosophila persimilis TaxID=7234 RepID=B4H0A3_DROPE|nr:GL14963 [Drosophila persimilis]